MSYTIPGPPPKQRPTVVRIAVYLLWAVVAINIINIILGLLPNPELDQALEEFNRENALPEGAEAANNIAVIAGTAFSALFTIALAVLAVFVGRGSQPARITTWALGGFLVLCQGCGLIVYASLPSLTSGAAGNEDAERAQRQAEIIAENTPAWLATTTTVLSVLSLIALILVIILLAVPAANDFFRKQEEVWTPPTGGGGFPQYPPPSGSQDPGAPPTPPAPPAPPTPPTQQ